MSDTAYVYRARAMLFVADDSVHIIASHHKAIRGNHVVS